MGTYTKIALIPHIKAFAAPPKTTLFILDNCVVTPLFNQQCCNHLCYFSCVEKACIFVYFAFSKYLMLVLINVFQLHSSTA